MKKTPFVFLKYKPYPPLQNESIEGAPDEPFIHGHVYYLDESETAGCSFFRYANGYDMRHRVIHEKE